MSPNLIEAYRRGAAGDFEAADALLSASAGRDSAAAEATRCALLAARHHAEPEVGALTPLSRLEALVRDDPTAGSAAGLCAAELGRAALLGLDVELLEDVARFAEGIETASIPEAALGGRLAAGWLALCRGDAERAATIGEDVARDATHAKVAGSVLEASALRAWAAAEAGDLGAATTLARRASRMARTEALPQLEYLVNLVLSRVRRLTGRPHLAIRILDALASVAPVGWRGLLAWELAMAGAPRRARSLVADAPHFGSDIVRAHAHDAARSLAELLASASDGARQSARHAAEAAGILAGGFAPWAADLDAVEPSIMPDARPARPEEEAFLSGSSHDVPPRLHGLCADLGAESAEEACAAWVHLQPDIRARRIVAIGAPLATADARLVPKRGRPGRTETTLAALALAGEDGLSVDALFEAVYGFAYEPALHANLFKVLLHRARGALSDRGVIERTETRCVVRVRVPLLVPDPRCEQPLEELVLRVLARSGGGDARSAAEALMLPLRTIQAALKQLGEEGAVEVDVKGRRHEYRIEDTTFAEPTRVPKPRS